MQCQLLLHEVLEFRIVMCVFQLLWPCREWRWGGGPCRLSGRLLLYYQHHTQTRVPMSCWHHEQRHSSPVRHPMSALHWRLLLWCAWSHRAHRHVWRRFCLRVWSKQLPPDWWHHRLRMSSRILLWERIRSRCQMSTGNLQWPSGSGECDRMSGLYTRDVLPTGR